MRTNGDLFSFSYKFKKILDCENRERIKGDMSIFMVHRLLWSKACSFYMSVICTCMWNTSSNVLWTNPCLRIFIKLDICSLFLIPLCLKHSQQVFRPYNYSSTKMMENYFASVSDSLLGFEVFCKYLCGKFGFALIRFCLLRKLYI